MSNVELFIVHLSYISVEVRQVFLYGLLLEEKSKAAQPEEASGSFVASTLASTRVRCSASVIPVVQVMWSSG